MQDPIHALSQLGLTGLEAAIYVYLLTNSPVTGYSVAKGLGKPTANVYKALETLAQKGAVEIDAGRKRLVRPIPYVELLRNLETSFTRLRDEAAASLAALPGPEQDHRIYQLSNWEQVVGKCEALLEGARSLVVADVFPEPAEMLRPFLEELTNRGIKVAVRSYAALELSGVDVNEALRGAEIRGRWPAQWLNLIVDGEHSVIAVFRTGSQEVIQAFWTSSPSLSYLHHSGLVAEMGYSRLCRDLAENRSREEMNQTVGRIDSYLGFAVPGYRHLLDKLGLQGLDETATKESSDD